VRTVLLAVVCALGGRRCRVRRLRRQASLGAALGAESERDLQAGRSEDQGAELEAGGIYFTANMVQHWFAELHALGRVGLPQHIPGLQTDARRAYRLMRYTGNPRPMDSALLRMKRDAATRGVHCSFGALPLSQVQ
jgi:hypothetical protein